MVEILVFSSPTCAPCRVLKPIIELIEIENPNVKLTKININENMDSVMDYEIFSVPTVIIKKNGQITFRIKGLTTKAILEAAII